MESVGKFITNHQNRKKNIEMLGAQRYAYSLAKRLFHFRFYTVVFIPIVFSFLSLGLDNYQDQMMQVTGIYALTTVVGGLLLDHYIKKLKKDAASIQEKFDCGVLQIPWNYVMVPKQPIPEVIHEYWTSYQQKNSTKDLYAWYPTIIESVATNISVLICQRANCTYDFAIRNKYGLFLIFLASTMLLVLLVPAYFIGLSIENFIIFVLFPLLPLFTISIQQYLDNRESIQNLNELKDLIEEKISSYKLTDTIDIQLIREIQNKIFCNRVLSPLLPDKFFYHSRPHQEEQMYYGVEQTLKSMT